MKKLLYITTDLNSTGGVSRVLSVKVNYLVEKLSYDVHILNTYSKTNAQPFYHFNKKVQIHSLDKNYSFYKLNGYKKEINKKINAIHPDAIINCDNGLKGALLPFLIDGKRILIFEAHSSEKTMQFDLKLILRNLFFRLNRNKYKYIVKLQKEDYNNVKVIPNPLSFEVPNEKPNFQNNIAIAVGRISPEKDYKTLIEAWNLVAKKYPNWKLHVYAEGDKTQLIRLVEKLGLANNVFLFDPAHKIKERYLESSMLLNTSKYESFGLTLIEALACGLPIVAFKNALDYGDYLESSESAFLVERHSINAYADMVCFLIDQIKNNKDLFVNAKDSVEKFKQDVIMRHWDDLFQSLP